jgi:uncharacterized protein (DUF983 family)
MMLRRGILRRCPVCGEGRIFRSLFRLHRACPACGWVIEREPGTVTGPMYLVSVLTLPFAALLFAVLWLFTEWTPAVQVAVGIPVILMFCAVALGAAKGAWAAVEYFTDVRSGDASREGYRERAFRRGDQEGGRGPDSRIDSAM